MELLILIVAVWTFILMIGMGRIWTHAHATAKYTREIRDLLSSRPV